MCTYSWLYYRCYHTSPDSEITLCTQARKNDGHCPEFLPRNEYFPTFVVCGPCAEDYSADIKKRAQSMRKNVKRQRENEELNKAHSEMLPNVYVMEDVVKEKAKPVRQVCSLLKFGWTSKVKEVVGDHWPDL